MTRAASLYFTSPGQVEVREETLPAPGPDQVLVETLCSAISPGTELLVYRGEFPAGLPMDASFPGMEKPFAYPLRYGYANVGVVRELGTQVNRGWQDRVVFCFHPHGSHCLARPDELHPVPQGVSVEAACMLPNLETAVNLVQDAAPLLGERALVLGQGIIGLLTASLLAEFPLEALVTADRYANRREASLQAGATISMDPARPDFREQALSFLHPGADLTIELSGVPAALNDALALTRFSGRVLIGSWYGNKQAAVELGGSFHRSRIKLISSQVSSIAPELNARWDKQRRFAVSWSALGRLRPEKWITQRFPLGQAGQAYRLLADHPEEAIQVVLTY